MLKKYIIDPSHALDYTGLQLDDRLTLEEYPVRLMDREERVLRSCSYDTLVFRVQKIQRIILGFVGDLMP